MGFERTRNHHIIRTWVEERGGAPIELQINDEVEGLITLNFGRFLLDDYRPVTWEEFFAWFDTKHLAFRYSDTLLRGQEDLSYNFVSGKNVSDTEEDETRVPEEGELVEENRTSLTNNNGRARVAVSPRNARAWRVNRVPWNA